MKKNIFKGVVITIAIIIVLTGLEFGTGYISAKYNQFFGKMEVQIDRDIFKESNTYIEGVADDLAKYKLELAKEKNETVRQAIIETIIDRYADFDSSKLENRDLRNFLEDIREGKIK